MPVTAPLLIVGLGNPGAAYATTRHNAGFMAIDHFADGHGLACTQQRWQGQYCRQQLLGRQVILLKPLTYMNRSGEAVYRFAAFYKIPPAHLLVVHDDIDLAAGRVKVVTRGGAGGHNGVRSVINHLHTADFPRIKIGIGRPDGVAGPHIPVERWVLAPFSPEERDRLAGQLDLACTAMELFISQDIQACMNRINRRQGA